MFLANVPNMIAIAVANVVALFILVIISIGCAYKLRAKTIESRILLAMIVSVMLASILDPFVFLFDGNSNVFSNPNGFMIFINHFGNGTIYLIDTLVGILWGSFLVIHLTGKIEKRRIIIYSIIMASGCIALIVNIFAPFIYIVDSHGVYQRVGYGYLVFSIVDILVLLDSIIVYIRIRSRGGFLKFFPIWGFLIPAVCGMIAQSLVYGISTINAGNALAIAGMMMTMQNDLVFCDKLTGLYNRYYLDRLKKKMTKSIRNAHYTAMMLDLNGFKKINDQYGHQEGDHALIVTGELLWKAVGGYGMVIRYAGDEFVIILNTQVDPIIHEVVYSIRKQFDAFNKTNTLPYRLSISLGYSKADFKNHTVDELMNEIDKKMYEDKQIQRQKEEDSK